MGFPSCVPEERANTLCPTTHVRARGVSEHVVPNYRCKAPFTWYILLAFCSAAKNVCQNFVTLYTHFQHIFKHDLKCCEFPSILSDISKIVIYQENTCHVWTYKSDSILCQKIRYNLSPCLTERETIRSICRAATCECFHLFTAFIVKCTTEMHQQWCKKISRVNGAQA